MIVARDVTVRIGRATLVDGIDLEIAAGEVVALVGPNGAGKSTLLAAIAGDRRLARGTVRLGGRGIAQMSARELAERRAFLPQHATLAAAFTALEVVRLGQVRLDDARARARLDEVELGAFADRIYPTLSGGEQQRVQLARVLAQLPVSGGALLLDEPTAALDLRHQRLVLQIARRAAQAGHAVAIVLHDLTLAARVADRICVLVRGAIVADGPRDAVVTASVLSAAYDTAVRVTRAGEDLLVTAL